MNVASIIHGAYGDYFQQLLCLRDYKEKNKNINLSIYFASESRYNEFKNIKIDFADYVGMWSELNERIPDVFFQFQVKDDELVEDVLEKLSDKVICKLDRNVNYLPYVYMRDSGLIWSEKNKFELSDVGRNNYHDLVNGIGIDDKWFDGRTVGFQWRYRSKKGGAVSGYGQQDPEFLVETYSKAFEKLIEDYDCRIIVAGMKVKTDDSNRNIVDGKYPEYGLNLDLNRSIHLPGKSWLLEMELIKRCDVFLRHPSGFSEGVYLTTGNAVPIDSPYHYLLKLIKYRVNMFNFFMPRNFFRFLNQPYSSDDIVKLVCSKGKWL